MFLLFYSFDYPVGKLSHNLFEDGTIDPYCFDLIEDLISFTLEQLKLFYVFFYYILTVNRLFTVKHFCKNIILNFSKLFYANRGYNIWIYIISV